MGLCVGGALAGVARCSLHWRRHWRAGWPGACATTASWWTTRTISSRWWILGARAPAVRQATLITFGATLTLQHYSDYDVRELFYLDRPDLDVIASSAGQSTCCSIPGKRREPVGRAAAAAGFTITSDRSQAGDCGSACAVHAVSAQNQLIRTYAVIVF